MHPSSSIQHKPEAVTLSFLLYFIEDLFISRNAQPHIGLVVSCLVIRIRQETPIRRRRGTSPHLAYVDVNEATNHGIHLIGNTDVVKMPGADSVPEDNI